MNTTTRTTTDYVRAVLCGASCQVLSKTLVVTSRNERPPVIATANLPQ